MNRKLSRHTKRTQTWYLQCLQVSSKGELEDWTAPQTETPVRGKHTVKGARYVCAPTRVPLGIQTGVDALDRWRSPHCGIGAAASDQSTAGGEMACSLARQGSAGLPWTGQPVLQSRHLVVTPHEGKALACRVRRVHGRYAQYFNAKHQRTGHRRQNRFRPGVSCQSPAGVSSQSPGQPQFHQQMGFWLPDGKL
jgi:hypothetical protein